MVGHVAPGLYAELTDVPLLLQYPTQELGGSTCDAFAQNHDVAPTILGALGVAAPVRMEGTDLGKLVLGELPARQYVTAGMDDFVWCRDESHVYFARNDGRDARLFDLCTDPEQQKNVASERPSVVQMMFERILSDAGGPLPDYRHLREQTAAEWWELYRFR